MCFALAVKQEYKNSLDNQQAECIKVLIKIIQANHFEAFRGYFELFKLIPINGC